MEATGTRVHADTGGAWLRERVAALERELQARKAQDALRAQRERELADFVEHAVVGLHKVGPDGTILWANRADWEMLGYTEAEYVGRNIAEFHADAACLVTIMGRVQAGITLRDQPAMLRCKDGSVRHVLISTNAHLEDGRFVNTRCFTRDVTEQRLAEQALREARLHLAAIVESSDDAIVGLDLRGRVTSWNQGAASLFGYAADEMAGRPITTIIPPELHHEEEEILARIAAGERVRHYETVRMRKDGGRLDVSLTVSPVRDALGRVIGASKVGRDITERKRSQREAAESDRRKDDFLAILAHELRNPLAPIRYALTIARQANSSGEQRARAEQVIERQVEHMGRLLDDLLDVSRIARGRVELRKKWIDLTSVIGAAIDAARPAMDAKGHALSLDLPAEPLRLEADAVRMAQILANLLNNAAKYTEPGGRIRLAAAREGDAVTLRVSDTGIGIGPEMMPRLFTLFSQARPARERSEGGLGIGLALVRAFVTLHGGAVEARSAGPGQGSEFTVRLPIGTKPSDAAAAEPAPVEEAAAARLRVLVADDNVDSAETSAMLLRLWGHEVRVARDGREALDAARAFRPQLAILDIGMPRLNGYQVAEALRGSDCGDGLTLVAVTGWGQEEDKQRAAAAGFDHHLAKPVDPAQLRPLIERVAAGGTAG